MGTEGTAALDEGLRAVLCDLAAGPTGATSAVLVRPATVAATRAALELLDAAPGPIAVTGWADLTAPNLVDLLDDLRGGPGGRHLRAIAAPWPTAAAWVDDVAVRRGLACLQAAGLELVLTGRGPSEVVAAITRLEPGLVVGPPPAP